MREEGLSLRAIAARLGISLSTASLWTRGIARPLVPAAVPVPPPAGALRRCSRCGRTLPETDFSRHGAGRQWWCRSCFRDYYAERRSHHRARGNALKARRVAEAQAYILGVLRSRPCLDCGVADPLVLEFDHVGDKRGDIATLVRRGVRLPVLAEEVARCEVVCANCHRRRTARRAGWRRLTGDLSDLPWRSPRHERNVRHVFAVLAASVCADCGEADACVLDFDHVGRKRSTMMRLARNEASLDRLRVEIGQCVVRCANCHRRRTAVEAGHFRAGVPPARIELALPP